MKITIFILLITLAASTAAVAVTDPPLLEEYNFDLAPDWSNLELQMLDRQLGPGGAQFRLEVRPVGKERIRIRMEIFRHVPKDTIMFALLLEEIRIQFQTAEGTPVKTIVLDEILGNDGLFIIGDSNDGYFSYEKTVSGLQQAGRLKVQVFGNFE